MEGGKGIKNCRGKTSRKKKILDVVATGRAGLEFSPLLGSIELQVKRNTNDCKAKYAKVKRKTEWE